MNDIFEHYPGSKNGSGVYQQIINLMPKHDVYIEPFLGGGAVMRNKQPAEINYGIDLDPHITAQWKMAPPRDIPDLWVFNTDGIEFLEGGAIHSAGSKRVLIYCDPPYLLETRRQQRQIYEFEMMERYEHVRLLEVCKRLPYMVMISGYWSELYATKLADWRVHTFKAMTRGGEQATEYVWMNFEQPLELHDYRYLGDNFRERERIKRKQTRWRERLKKMPDQERYAMFSVLEELKSGKGSD